MNIKYEIQSWPEYITYIFVQFKIKIIIGDAIVSHATFYAHIYLRFKFPELVMR